MRKLSFENPEMMDILNHQVIHMDQGVTNNPEYIATRAMRHYPSRTAQLIRSVYLGELPASPYGADMVFALEDAKIGMMDSKLAAQIMYAGEAEAVRTEKAAEYAEVQSSAVSAAKRGYVDSIISADAVRQQLVYTFEMLYTKREARPSKKHGTV